MFSGTNMKALCKILRYLAFVLIISNLPFISEILTIFFYSTVGRSFDFISKDAHFYAHGGIQTIKANDKYLEYVKATPKADHTPLTDVLPNANGNTFSYGEFI